MEGFERVEKLACGKKKGRQDGKKAFHVFVFSKESINRPRLKSFAPERRGFATKARIDAH